MQKKSKCKIAIWLEPSLQSCTTDRNEFLDGVDDDESVDGDDTDEVSASAVSISVSSMAQYFVLLGLKKLS
ncbi:hypothetical protein OUZ56_033674 [Daphnia magna]|uniref:Uncharacterized protein n=1 Tax=Daphnia magna TaxID=35525 RepID=A0ABQ9Z1M9_9CRUS|nr:hypothetical protein OUZ56_011968 [Daphnia magna]KAK4017828.1 hypothetical protein OUZ56_033674 [Daphnia magna]